jgi:GMP synthase-like glutamine amidotransferase
MKPVAIFRFSPTEGPGYFATFLARHRIAWELVKLDQGDALPLRPQEYAGFVFMGGPMSVNDTLPWIPPVLNLIRTAIRRDQPCLGHCLGGQLMSKALGGKVTKNPVKEIGWNPVHVADNDIAREWLGTVPRDWTTFQWHGETFTIPRGATRVLTGTTCENQAFVIGKSLGMQCHVEMTPQMIETWCRDWRRERVNAGTPGIQTPDEMRAAMEANLAQLNRVADALYTKWIAGLDATLRR